MRLERHPVDLRRGARRPPGPRPRRRRGPRSRGRRRSPTRRGCRRAAARRGAAPASGTSTPAIRLAATTSKAGSPLGRLPTRARIRRAMRCASRSRPWPRWRSGRCRRRPRGPPRGGSPRWPGCRSRTRHRGPGRRPARRRGRRRPRASARHSRVVGWRPVPNAMPGSSARTSSSATALWRRHVGRMTSRRPTAAPGSRPSRHWPSRPRGRSGSAARRSAAARTPAGGRARRRPMPPRPRRPRGRGPGGRHGPWPAASGRPARRAPPRPGRRRARPTTPPGAARPRISLTASTASTSASTESSSQAPCPSARGAHPSPSFSRMPPAAVDLLAALGGQLGQQLALALRELGRHDDVDQDVEVALRARPAEMRHALAAQPDLRVGLGAGLDLDLLLAVDRRDLDLRPERRLGDRDRRLEVELGAFALERRVRRRGRRRRGCRAVRRAARPRPRSTGGSGGPRRCRPGS